MTEYSPLSVVFQYTRSAFTSRLIVLAVDVFLVLLAIVLASAFRFNFEITQIVDALVVILPLTFMVRLMSFRWFRTYAVIVRFAGASDVLKVFYAISGGSLLMIGLAILLRPYGIQASLSVLLIDFFLAAGFLGAFRMMMPALYQMTFGQRIEKDNVLLIGAGRLGAITSNLIRQDLESSYSIAAILDDNKSLQNKSLDGIPVFAPAQLEQLLQEYGISKAIFAIRNIKSGRKNEIVDLCLEHGIQVLQVPAEASWADDHFNISQIKEIEIEDLLDRPVISLSEDNVTKQYKDKKVMITGGAGSIGSEIVRQLIKYDPAKIFILDEAESPLVAIDLECKEDYNFTKVQPIIGDVTDMPRLVKIFDEHCLLYTSDAADE